MQQAQISRPRVEPGEIEALLLQHPDVKEAVVFTPEDDPERKLIAYVAADLTDLKTRRAAASSVNASIVGRWNKLYELTYSSGPTAPTFVGWNSSYTREPIPEAQMHEWLHATVQRVRALNPRRVLEIGCGVGLLLQHLAPDCEIYVGTDFSASALTRLQQWTSQQRNLRHVQLLHCTATELHGLEPGGFDTVILNSVVQYFPNIDYLLTVLRQAVRLLTPDGKLFIGDVRHLGLLSTFHSAVQLSRATDSVTVAELRRRVIRAVTQETELAIDPQFFRRLPGSQPGLSGVDVLLRRGHAQNELTRYRYDVVLHAGEQACDGQIHDSVIDAERDWHSADELLTELAANMRQRHWHRIRLHGIPNQRLARDQAARLLIETSHNGLTAGALRNQLEATARTAIDPERLWEWGQSHGYDVSIGWDPRDKPDCFELQLRDPDRPNPVSLCTQHPPQAVTSWSEYANDPAENSLGQQLLLRLREYLSGLLPEASIPSAWTISKHIPLTPDAKHPTPRRALDVFFSASVRRYPDRPAIFVAGRSWSYQEMDAECVSIERRLCAAGLARTGRRVGLIYARALFSYAAIIAIMRTDCVYVPLNPNAPMERWLKIIDDAGVTAVIVDATAELSEGVIETLRRSPGLRIITNDPDSPVSSVHIATADACPASPQLAYILYTSGSTGEPKGVAIAHESACRCIEKLQRLFEATEQDRFTQFCALSFDYSLVELFVCWKAGAAVHVPEASEALVPLNFAVTHQITVWFSVPSLANFMVKLGLLKDNILPGVRLSLFGGEALPFELAQTWAAAAPHSRILNLYGPTEVTIVSTYCPYPADHAPCSGMVPIGVPLPGLRALIVDEGRIVEAEDAPGELWLAGDQLALEYWKNPAATAAAFVHSPAGETFPGTWYRTGDRVSYRHDTGISFRGRIDRQIKMRGLRIELQEIETVLREVTGSSLVAVVPLRNTAGICERVIAYCDRLTAAEPTLKTRCLEHIPPYMVPERIFELADFPLSAHGKIDYQTLAEYAASHSRTKMPAP